MSAIALYHSVLGLRPGVLALADDLRTDGHVVAVVDQYDGEVFDEYTEAMHFAEAIGYPALMQRALDAVADLPDGFIAAGFSNGGGMSEYVATQRTVSAVVLLSGTLPLPMIGVDRWPSSTAVQVHYASGDPFRNEEWLASVIGSIEASGAQLETHFDYQVDGHLFSDPSLSNEYDADAASLLHERVREFCAVQGGA